MKPRPLQLIFLALLALGVAGTATAGGIAPAEPFADEASSIDGTGCDLAPADPAFDEIFGPAPSQMTSGMCGACSADPCAGISVGMPCYQWIQGTWGFCIPPYTQFCPDGGANTNNWACQCATDYH